MAEIIKDYGSFIGPFLAFILGIIAIYIKFSVDTQVDQMKSQKKLKKLITLIKESKPPKKYFPKKSESFINVDEARNLTNLTIFKLKLDVILAFIESIENDILINCTSKQIMQFYELKFVSKYLLENIDDFRNGFEGNKKFEETNYNNMMADYKRLIIICDNPEVDFKYAGDA